MIKNKIIKRNNYLGKVMITISGKKFCVPSSGNSSLIDHFNADVVNANDNYPFGMIMPGRKYLAPNASPYRYSINGQEKELDLNEDITTAEYWEYDSRIARRWNIDPVLKESESPYLCFSANPVLISDKDGDSGDPPSGYIRGKNGDNLGGTRFMFDDFMSKYFSTGMVYPSYVAQALNFAEATGGIIEGTNLDGSATNNPQTFKPGSTVVVRLSSSSEIVTGTIKTLKRCFQN